VVVLALTIQGAVEVKVHCEVTNTDVESVNVAVAIGAACWYVVGCWHGMAYSVVSVVPPFVDVGKPTNLSDTDATYTRITDLVAVTLFPPILSVADTTTCVHRAARAPLATCT
jgi:hypothetical protein